MIVDAILGWIAGLVEGAANLMPTWEPNIPSTGPIVEWLAALNYFLPIGEVLGIVMATLALGLPLILVSLALWVVALVRGGSARG